MRGVRDLSLCPITKMPMREPVIAEDGHTYDREAIEKWLSLKHVSPMTNQPMQAARLQPNPLVRDIIRAMGGIPDTPRCSPTTYAKPSPVTQPKGIVL